MVRTNMATKKTITKKNIDKVWEDIEVPIHLRGGSFHWNFEKRMPLTDKITWVLTAVNVAILITLFVTNY